MRILLLVILLGVEAIANPVANLLGDLGLAPEVAELLVEEQKIDDVPILHLVIETPGALDELGLSNDAQQRLIEWKQDTDEARRRRLAGPPVWTKKKTECGDQYPWQCCTIAGSDPDICPFAAYNTQDGDAEFGCHGSDYTVGYGMSLDACKEACAENDKASWGVAWARRSLEHLCTTTAWDAGCSLPLSAPQSP